MSAQLIPVKPMDVRSKIEGSGVSIAEWARANGFSTNLVYSVLEGKRKCLRGQSFRIAVALGMREGKPETPESLTRLLSSGGQTIEE